MAEHDRSDGDRKADGRSRRELLRALTATTAAGSMTGLAGCFHKSDWNLNPSGQTVAYKTPADELRWGELGITVNPPPQFTGHAVENEQVVTAITNPPATARIALSPNANEVAYVEGNSQSLGTDVVIRPLSGGSGQRYSLTNLASYLSSGTYRYRREIENGHIQTLDWCPNGGSDTLGVVVQGGYENAIPMLVRFDRSANTTEVISEGMNKALPGVAWSESCNEIVYKRAATPQSSSQASTGLYELNVTAGTTSQRVSNARSPTWGTTGVAYVQNDDIWLNYAGGSTQQLTAASGPDFHPVLFDQQSGESLAYNRNTGTQSNPNRELRLIERVDQSGPYTPETIATDKPPTVFDIA